MPIIALLIIIAIIQLSLNIGMVVEARRTNNEAQKVFAGVATSFLLWTLSLITLVFVDSSYSLENIGFFNFANYLGFALGALSLTMVYVFNQYYPVKKQTTMYNRVLTALGLVLVVLSFSSQVAGKFFIQQDGTLAYEAGDFSIIFVLYAIVVIFSLIFGSARTLRHSKDILLKQQVKTILLGMVLTFVHGVVFLVVLAPLFDNNVTLYAIGYLAPYYYIGFTIYSLVRQRLFDIRLIVARTVAYALSFGVVILAAGFIIFVPLDYLVEKIPFQFVRQALEILLALVLAIAYQPTKKYFDKITNRFFYQDAYDTQALLDELNTVLVTTIDFEKLLTNSTKIINSSIKSEFIYFGIKSTDKTPQRLIGEGGVESQNEYKTGIISEIIRGEKQKTFVADILGESKQKIKQQMNEKNIAIVVRLTDSPSNLESDIGYLVVGNKKSGSPFSGQDVKVLEIIADELVIAIQNAMRFEEIQKFNITLQEKVDDATKKLRAANKRLIELDQTKDDFISMASHQLRTPLTSIKGYVSMVMEGDAGKITKKQNDLLNQSFLSAQRMVYLIADLLNVSRLRTGKFVIEPKKTNLAEVIEGEMSQLTETAKARNLELNYKKPNNFPELMLDETKIRQVLMNFIDNAIYYTPSGGHISVNLEDKGEEIKFTVVDDGIGVPKNVQHNLFNKFYRADNAKKARPDGTGLGLFMAKKVIVAQGGSIIFSSQEGKGSTFGFSFTKRPLLPENFKGVEVKQSPDK